MYSDERTVSQAATANLGQLNTRVAGVGAPAEMRPRELRPAGTVSGILSHADSVQGLSLEKLTRLNALANRALDLASRLSGPFPESGLDASEKGPANDPSVSALDEAQRRVAELRRPLVAMDAELNRLSDALDAIERAFG